MKILLTHNDGGGFADYVEVPEGTTVGQLFKQRIGEIADPHAYKIRVNRSPAPSDQVLQDRDTLSIAPTKIEGARA